MKKYKLKQWYPALPNHVKVGDIATVTEYGDNGLSCNVFKIFFNDDEWHIVSKRELHPDFWELIEEEKPLFVTEDGVEVYDIDFVVFAVKGDFLKIQTFALAFSQNKNDMKSFYHESNADEYIWQNTRVFSYNDFKKFQSGGEGVWYDIKAIAKERSKG